MGTFRVTAKSGLQLRSGPGTGYPIVVALPNGAVVEGTGPAWRPVSAGGLTGWVSDEFLEPVEKGAAPAISPPKGIAAIRALFGDPDPLIQANGTVADSWPIRVQGGRVKLPEPLPLSWKTTARAYGIACHPLIATPLQAVIDAIYTGGAWKHLADYGGCYEWRNARGLVKLSTHCWAIAVDLNANSNPLGAKPKMHADIVDAFEAHGFTWGGRWSRPDGMHFQYCTGY